MPFDVSEGAESPVLDLIAAGPAAALTAVAVVVAPRARTSGWGADVAVALARRWGGPRRVLLLDLDLERPVLHERLGVRNDEGVIDLVEYGVSPRRVRRDVDGGRFDLISAGPFTADPGAVLRHDAWARLLVEAAVHRTTVLAVVPADADGAETVIERVGAVLVVAEPGEADPILDHLAHTYSVLAVLTRSEPEPRPEPQPEPEPEPRPVDVPVAPAPSPRLTDAEFERIRLPTERGARDALIADLRERQRAARLEPHSPPVPRPPAPAPPPAGAGPAASEPAMMHVPDSGGDVAREMRVEGAADDVRIDELDALEPAAGDAPKRRRRIRYDHPIGWTVTIVLMGSLLAGAWHFLSRRVEGANSVATADATRSADAAAAAAAAAADTGAAALGLGEAALPYAVAIEAHRDVPTAVDRVATLSAAEPGTPFHVAPLEREGTVFYHVMAGPLPDSAAAVALRDTLIARGHKTGVTPTDVRAAPLAFAVGEHAMPAAAAEQLDELRRLGVPGYMITVGAAGQPPRYRTYVGGFATPAEADVVGRLLRAAGVRDSLVTRTGSIIQ